MTAVSEWRLADQRPTWASERSEKAQQSIRKLGLAGLRYGVSTSLTETSWMVRTDAVERRFQALAARWREECGHLSSIREMIIHPAYQQIIGMGPAVLPHLLAELARRPGHWFWALTVITGEDPVRQEHRGIVRAMAGDWLEWAETRGIRW